MGWAGLREHEADATLLSLNDVFAEMLEQHPHARLITVGLRLRLNHTRYEHRAAVPLADLAQHLQSFDIGVAPLADNAFNRARSNIKLKEYAIAGASWLASPVGEYARLGSKQGGRLVADDNWQPALSRLIQSKKDRLSLKIKGQLWARRQTIELNAHRWEEAFSAAVAVR